MGLREQLGIAAPHEGKNHRNGHSRKRVLAGEVAV